MERPTTHFAFHPDSMKQTNNTRLAATTRHLLLSAALTLPGAAAILQGNYGTGDEQIPGGTLITAGNLLATNLTSASRTGSFYREDSGYTVSLERLYDGDFGTIGSTGLGSDGHYTVMPGVATIRFQFDGAFSISSIRTYASWDSGRSGQQYTVRYATASAPSNFITLYSLAAFNNADSAFPVYEDYDPETGNVVYRPDTSISSTLVELTSTNGILAEDVVALEFQFTGYQNNGTAYREFQVTAVPEPTSALLLAGGATAGLILRRRRREIH